MVQYDWNNVSVVPNEKDLFDVLLLRCFRQCPSLSKCFEIDEIRLHYAEAVSYVRYQYQHKLSSIIDQFPELDHIYPFHTDLLRVLDNNGYTFSLGQIKTAIDLIGKIANEHIKLFRDGDSLDQIRSLKVAAFGPMYTVIQCIAPSLALLEHVRQYMATLCSYHSKDTKVAIVEEARRAEGVSLDSSTLADEGIRFVTNSAYKRLLKQMETLKQDRTTMSKIVYEPVDLVVQKKLEELDKKSDLRHTMEEKAQKERLNASKEYTKFLQDIVQGAKGVQNSTSVKAEKTAEDLAKFMSKVKMGIRVSNDEILGFSKLFNDELMLDNISRPRLVNMCKYLGISPDGRDACLPDILRERLQWIKKEDKMIQAKGLDSLSELEIRQACKDRGLRLLSVDGMRHQLREWLDLSLNYFVPSSFFILSRAFSVSVKLRPDEVVDFVGVAALPSDSV